MNSEFISNILNIISHCIDNDRFEDVEKAKVELKDLSSGSEWTSLKQTICAFLNSEGGVVICGVRERNGKYSFTGFDRTKESTLISLQHETFKDDNDNILDDLTEHILFDYVPFRSGEVAVIVVKELTKDIKYVKYNNKYYQRQLTGDKEISPAKINSQKEYKQELQYAKEISIIPNAIISDLSLDKINKYVNLLNLEIRNTTLKASISKAREFLLKQHFLNEDRVTTLGMLVCGDDPFHFLENRCEVDCYYDTASDISKDKKIFRNDVISLMEDTFKYIWGHIKIHRTIKGGGSSEPEFPEAMIREVINNALAHRDYTINNFITVTVEPDKYIEIKNPGTFKEKIIKSEVKHEIPIRRLIQGIPESKNPKLAGVLKVFDKIESQGRGMASLINAAIDNLIDLPYYEVKDNIVSLKIPSGKLVDDGIENWIRSYQKYLIKKLKSTLTIEHKQMLAYFYKSEVINKKRFFTILLNESNNHFEVIDQLKETGVIYEHELSSDESPVYILDRELMKVDFTNEIIELVGGDYTDFDEVAKQTLNLLYRFTKYNQESLKPSEITPEIYRVQFGKNIDPKKYESLGRKVRRICNELHGNKILIKDPKSAYSLNFNYVFGNDTMIFP